MPSTATKSIALGVTGTNNPDEINIGGANVLALRVGIVNYSNILIGRNITIADTKPQGVVALGDGITATNTASFSGQIMIGEGIFNATYENVLIGQGSRANAATGSLNAGTVGVAIGEFTELNGDCVVALGHDAFTMSDFSNAIGPHARAGEDNTTASCNSLGRFATSRGNASMALGGDSLVSTGHTNSIACGKDATTTAAKQMMIGAALWQINAMVWNGGASGSNINGGTVALTPGLGTGSGTPGKFMFRGAQALGSGSTLQTAVDVVAIDFAGVNLQSSKVLKVNNTQVVTAQQAAVADATDATSVIARLNDLLARLRTHGLIAP